MEPPSPSPSPAPASELPADAPVVGKFRLDKRLGAGGMGEVWKAWDDELRRWVALKFMKNADAEELARFKREAQIAARLSHPNIAAVYEVGDDAQRPFIVMQYVRGRTMRGFPRDDRRLIARLVRDAALAVDYAHHAGIVHRDLKPENLMVSGDHVFVMDFGLARTSHENSSLTRSGAVLGTPAYMSPEQARGETRKVDARTDVYSLGATLYDALTGQPPFASEAMVDVLVLVATEEPRPPRAVDRSIEADLETIVMRCLDKAPSRRYASARALADDLTRWLDGEPIHASRPSLVSRVRRRLAKRKPLVAGVAVTLAACAVLVPVLLRMRRAERELALWTEVAAHLEGARALSRTGDVARARARADQGIAACRAAIARDDFPQARYFLGRLLALRGRTDEAEQEFERALRLDSGLGEARHERGRLLAERYLLAVLQRRSRTHQQAAFGSDEPPTVAEIERDWPPLAALRKRAEADLAVKVGRTSYFSDADALYGTGLLAQARGDHGAARRTYAEMLDQWPLWAAAHVQLATMAYLEGRYDEALDHVNDALKVDAGIRHAWRLRTYLALAQSRVPAIEDVDRWFRDEERPSAEDLLLRGLVHRKRSNPDAALVDFRRGLEMEPDHPWLLVNLAQMEALAGDFDAALRNADRALRASPRDGVALFVRAGIHEGRRDVAAALADLDAAAARLPKFADVFAERARLRLQSGDPAGAVRDGDHIVALNPKDASAWSNLGLARQMNGDVAGAREAFDRAIELAPEAHTAWAARAIGRFKAGDSRGAHADADRAASLGSTHAELFVVLGMCRRSTGRLREAIEALDRALAIHPRHAYALSQRGACRQLAGEPEQARKDYDAAIAIDPRQDEALANRGMMKAMARDLDGALADLDASLAVKRSHEVLFNRGLVKHDLGDRPGAAADFKEVLRLAPAEWPRRAVAEEILQKLRE